MKSGLIVNGSFVEVPRQRNTKDENAQIKAGEVPESIASKPNRARQKEADACWTKKNDVPHFGYKNHVLADTKTKLIADYGVTDASVHDRVPFLDLVPKRATFDGQPVYADSAYTGENIKASLEKRKYKVKICEKGYRNHLLTEKQKESNRKKSKVRCRIKPIFGVMKSRARDEALRSIDLVHAKFGIGLRNLIYNMSRFVVLKTPQKRQA